MKKSLPKSGAARKLPAKSATPAQAAKLVVRQAKAATVSYKSPKLIEKVPPPPEKPLPAIIETPDDGRQLVRMPSPARLALRAEMRDRMAAVDTVMQLMSAGKTNEAGEVARDRLGVAIWGEHRRLPKAAQPEPYMPQEMQAIALDGYKAASDFATVALTGDHHTATALLPQLTGSCTQCHQAYRIR